MGSQFSTFFTIVHYNFTAIFFFILQRGNISSGNGGGAAPLDPPLYIYIIFRSIFIFIFITYPSINQYLTSISSSRDDVRDVSSIKCDKLLAHPIQPSCKILREGLKRSNARYPKRQPNNQERNHVGNRYVLSMAQKVERVVQERRKKGR